jgi:hypothetical protein
MSEEIFQTWLNQWNDALKTDAFKKEERADDELLFVTESVQKNNTSKCDEKYWEDIWKLSLGFNGDQNAFDDYLNNKLTNEEVDQSVKNLMKALTMSPNPIKPSSVGMDQDPTNVRSLDLTYTDEDIDELAKLKSEIEELKIKLASKESLGEKPEDISKKIETLQKKVNELSDKMTQTMPNQS